MASVWLSRKWRRHAVSCVRGWTPNSSRTSESAATVSRFGATAAYKVALLALRVKYERWLVGVMPHTRNIETGPPRAITATRTAPCCRRRAWGPSPSGGAPNGEAATNSEPQTISARDLCAPRWANRSRVRPLLDVGAIAIVTLWRLPNETRGKGNILARPGRISCSITRPARAACR